MTTMTDSALLRKLQRAGVYIYDENVCHGYCTSKAPPAPATLKAALDSPIDIDLNVRGATLAPVGRLLASITECEISIPATRIDERRDLCPPGGIPRRCCPRTSINGSGPAPILGPGVADRSCYRRQLTRFI